MDLPVARAALVLEIVLGIGGVAMVTTVLLPAVARQVEPGKRVDFFAVVGSHGGS